MIYFIHFSGFLLNFVNSNYCMTPTIPAKNNEEINKVTLFCIFAVYSPSNIYSNIFLLYFYMYYYFTNYLHIYFKESFTFYIYMKSYLSNIPHLAIYYYSPRAICSYSLPPKHTH